MDPTPRSCPRCAFTLAPAAPDCARCGVVLAKLERAIDATVAAPAAATTSAAVDASEARPPARPSDLGEDRPAPSALDRSGRRSLALGAAIAAVVLALPFTRFVQSYVLILVHELGHAACGWLFGYPSVPAFDFAYGGGVTSIEERRASLVVILACGQALLLWALRTRPRALALAAAAVAGWGILAATAFHESLVLLMGHTSELVFAGIFFYRALSGYAVRVGAERPLYAFLAWFIVARDLVFAWGLMTSEHERRAYADAKGGGHWMDFSQVAHDLGVPLQSVAGVFLLATLVTLPLTWLAFRHRETLAAAGRRLLAPRGA